MSASTTQRQSFLDRHYLLIRRLHSLSGIVPIGVFLFPHLTTNSSIVWGSMFGKVAGADAIAQAGVEPHGGVMMFQHEVEFIHNLPALILIEWGLLFLPIAFHALVGVWFATSGRVNVQHYGYQNNWRYTLQRLTGYVGVVFILLHITSLRFGFTYGNLFPAFDGHRASSSTAAHFQDGVWGLFVAAFYLVGMLSLVFHFANGLWTAAITWGLTVSEGAQKRWGYVCTVIGVALGAAGIAAVVGFSMLDVDNARQIETLLASGM